HELAHCHVADVGLDEQGGLGLTYEDVTRRRKGLGSGGAHGALHEPSDALHNLLHHTQVIEHGHEGTEEDDGGQHVKGEDETKGLEVAGGAVNVHHWTAGGGGGDAVVHRAKQERGTRVGEGEDLVHRLACAFKDLFPHAGAHDEQAKDE